MPSTPTSNVSYASAFGILAWPGGTATFYDGCNYDDGDIVIQGGIVTAFDPSGLGGGGVTDHDDLGNLGWAACGHTGTANRLAYFDGSGATAFLSIGSNLSVSGGALNATGTTDHTALSNLAWGSSGHTSTANRVAIFNGSGAAAVSNDLTFNPTSKELFSTLAIINGLYLPNVIGDRVCITNSSSLVISSSVTSTELGYLSGVTSGIQSQINVAKAGLRISGRLTLETGVPFSTTNQTGKTSVYWTPYDGNIVPIYDSTIGDFVSRSSAEISVAVPSTLFRLYDIFAYWTGSAVALEATNWNQTTASVSAFNAGTQTFTTSAAHGCSVGDYVGFASITGTVGTDSTYGVNGHVWKVATVPTSTTLTLEGSNLGSLAYTSGGTLYRIPNTRATALTLVNGICVKSGDSTRTWLGTGMTWGTSGQTEMSFGSSDCKLLLWNKYNPLPTVAQTYNYASHSYTGTSWRFWNLNPANVIWSISGEPTSAFALLACDGQGGEGYTAIGFDGVTGNNNPFKNNNTYQVAGGVPGVWARQYPGLNAIRAVEFGATGWASTYVSLQLYMDM